MFSYSSRIVSLADKRNFLVFTSPVCLAIAFHFTEKKFGSTQAKRKIQLLCDHIKVAPSVSSTVKKALSNPAVRDFEDGIEYYSAVENYCICIITEDINDFYFAEIEVLNTETFFKKYF